MHLVANALKLLGCEVRLVPNTITSTRNAAVVGVLRMLDCPSRRGLYIETKQRVLLSSVLVDDRRGARDVTRPLRSPLSKLLPNLSKSIGKLLDALYVNVPLTRDLLDGQSPYESRICPDRGL